ncbi:MAG: DUF86 domain-containing protein [Candidatus Nanohalobium sp.]
MKAEKETLKQKMQVIDENLRYLENQNPANLSESDFEKLQAVKHSLFEITEACIDISSHIIAAEGFEKPEEYAGMFPVLSKNKIITEELASKLEEMARFRNLLVHRYGEIESEKLEEFIREELEDVKQFTSSIYKYMEQD